MIDNLSDLGEISLMLGEPGPAKEYFTQALALHCRVHDERDDQEKVDILRNLGKVYKILGDPVLAEECYEQASIMKQALHKRDATDPIASNLHSWLLKSSEKQSESTTESESYSQHLSV